MADPNSDETESQRGPGRPRKWENEAERARAYRVRKAEEQASVDELRRDRRGLRRQVAWLMAKLERSEQAATDAERRAEALADDVAKLALDLDLATAEVARLHLELVASREAASTELGQLVATRRTRTAEAQPAPLAPPDDAVAFSGRAEQGRAPGAGSSRPAPVSREVTAGDQPAARRDRVGRAQSHSPENGT